MAVATVMLEGALDEAIRTLPAGAQRELHLERFASRCEDIATLAKVALAMARRAV